MNFCRAMAPNTRNQKNKEIIYEQEKKKGYNQKPLKLKNGTENMVIDTMIKSPYIDKSAEHLIILSTHDADKSLDEARSKEEYAFSKISIEKVLSLDDWIQNKNPNHF